MMFYKRFVATLLMVILALGLGTSVLAQDHTEDNGSARNPVLEWLDSLSDHKDQNKAIAWQLFETLEDVLRGASHTETLDRLSLFKGLQSTDVAKFENWDGFVRKWSNALQQRDSSQMSPFVTWLQQMAERLEALLNKAQKPNPLVRALSNPGVQKFIGLKTAQ